MKKIELLIFDLDGTLIDSKKDLADGINYALKTLGYAEIPEKEVYKCVGQGSKRMLANAMGDDNPVKVEQAVNCFMEYYGQHLLDYTVLYHGVAEMLNYYQEKKKAVVTNKGRKFSEAVLKGLGVLDKFDILLGHEDIEKPKPHPMPLLQVMKNCKISPEKTVMVGDGTQDIIAAREAGIVCCAVGYGLNPKAELLAEHPDYFVENIVELKDIFV